MAGRGFRRGSEVIRPSRIFSHNPSTTKRPSSSDAAISSVGFFAMNQLSPESERTLRTYLSGTIDLAALAAWLVQADYDTDLPAAERDLLAGVRLDVIEASEGLAREETVREGIKSVLKTATARGERQSA